MRYLYAVLLVILPLRYMQAQREYLPTPGDLEHFYNTKTYVVLEANPLSDYNMEIRDAVNKYWNITDYEFLSFEEFEEKSRDPDASFLYQAAVSFEKDRTRARYTFLCLSMGGDVISLDDLKDLANIPLSYYGLDADHYAYKLGVMVRFLQDHIRLITKHPEFVTQNVYRHYNENMADVRGKTLYLVKDEVESSIASEVMIRQIYPYHVRLVDREKIKELIMSGDEDAVILHKVGPEGKNLNARVYKILIGAADGKFYYYSFHKVTNKKPDAFLADDLKKITRAGQ